MSSDDFPEDHTPIPIVLRPGMSPLEADLELANNEINRLRLERATHIAQIEELKTQIRRLQQTIVARAKREQ
jgi:hypothetical protein